MATQVDFYLFDHNDEQLLIAAVCRLTTKAFAAGYRVFIHVPTAVQAKQLDQALWDFDTKSFIPHSVQSMAEKADDNTSQDTQLDAVLIGTEPVNDESRNMLISMSQALQSSLGQFTRLADIIPGTEIAKSKGRQCYATYRDQGLVVKAHQMGKSITKTVSA